MSNNDHLVANTTNDFELMGAKNQNQEIAIDHTEGI